jgi:hypothetical protein
VKRKLRDSVKQQIKRAFQAYGGSGIPEQILLDACARHAIGLLELPPETLNGYFVKEDED